MCSAALNFCQQVGRRHYTNFPRNHTTGVLLKLLLAINIGSGLTGLCWGSGKCKSSLFLKLLSGMRCRCTGTCIDMADAKRKWPGIVSGEVQVGR